MIEELLIAILVGATLGSAVVGDWVVAVLLVLTILCVVISRARRLSREATERAGADANV
jgi:uncharacterized membrane protein